MTNLCGAEASQHVLFLLHNLNEIEDWNEDGIVLLGVSFHFHLFTLYSEHRKKRGKMHLCDNSLLGVLALNARAPRNL
jgi:hypothetical protein